MLFLTLRVYGDLHAPITHAPEQTVLLAERLDRGVMESTSHIKLYIFTAGQAPLSLFFPSMAGGVWGRTGHVHRSPSG